MIKTRLENGIFTIAYNRPESMNAMNQALGNRFREAMRTATRDPEVRAVVLTGEGKCFSAGGDIKNLGNADPLDPLSVRYGNDPRWNATEMRVERLMESAMGIYQLRTMGKPTIAMVNGPAIGAGMAAALACDFRFLSDQAYFNSGYTNIALSGDIGFSYLLTSVVGPARAKEIMFFARKIEPDEALRLGLATRVVPHARLLEQTMAFASELAAGPTLTLGHMKENINAALELDPRTAFNIEARNFIRCFETEDHKESVAAFKEKRRPVFKGR
jgi:2-(1,2-epoxy-1,2-dihydrophenyl)acetyl-CoA isomerase